VFVVGCLGDGAAAAKVLFESESVRRDSAPSREKGKGVAADAQEGVGTGGIAGGFRMQAFGEYADDGTASAMKARDYKDATDLVAAPIVIDRAAYNQGENAQYKPHIEHSETMDSLVARGPHAVAIPIHDQATRNAGKRGDKQDGKGKPGDPAPTLTKGDKHAVLYENHPNDSRVTGPHEVAPSCVSRFGTGGGNVPLVQEAIAFQESELRLTGKITEQAVCPTLKANTKAGDTEPKVVAFEPGIAKREGNDSRFVEEMSPTLRKDMGDNQVAVAFQQNTRDEVRYINGDGKIVGALSAESGMKQTNYIAQPEATAVAEPVSVDIYNQATSQKHQTLRAGGQSIEQVGGTIDPRTKMAVRRLTPKECERLQGFFDDHTLIPWRGKPADQCPDGPRYKALGNSMAVPCMRWIGERIARAENERQGVA